MRRGAQENKGILVEALGVILWLVGILTVLSPMPLLTTVATSRNLLELGDRKLASMSLWSRRPAGRLIKVTPVFAASILQRFVF